MKYVIEKNGTALQISGWSRGFAKECNLAGLGSAPKNLPFDLKGGRKLRAVRIDRVSLGEFQVAVDDPGTVIGEEWVITQAAVDINLTDARRRAIDQVGRIRDRIAAGGIVWSPDQGVTTYEVQSDKDSRFEMAGAVQVLEYTGATEQVWRMKDNSLVILTLKQFKDMGVAIRDHVNACYVRQAELEFAIKSASVEDLRLNLDIEAGWPDELPELGASPA